MSTPELSKEQLHTLWTSGVDLDAAWVEFAKFFDRYALTALRTAPANDPDILGLNDPRYKQLNKGWLPKTWELRQKKLAITRKNERLHLLGEIYAGHLWAIGFRTLPSGFDELIRVPRQFFFCDGVGERGQLPIIHWNKGELKVDSGSYFDIRVVRAPSVVVQAENKTDGLAAKPHSKPLSSNRRKKVGGRPNTRQRIIETAKRLSKTDAEFRTMHMKEKVPRVRAHILGVDRQNEEARGYKTSSMTKAIGSALRNQNKRNKPNKP